MTAFDPERTLLTISENEPHYEGRERSEHYQTAHGHCAARRKAAFPFEPAPIRQAQYKNADAMGEQID